MTKSNPQQSSIVVVTEPSLRRERYDASHIRAERATNDVGAHARYSIPLRSGAMWSAAVCSTFAPDHRTRRASYLAGTTRFCRLSYGESIDTI
ncbi:MAG: hypothetical protein VX990_02485 [Pseudomonadota bacterium]|nr:hypothetical protein [Pseudomonadota bacterium]